MIKFVRLRKYSRDGVLGVAAGLAAMAPLAGAAAQRTGAFTDIQSQALVFGGQPGGEDGAGPVRDLSFEIYAPPHYDPIDPPGVLVFISPVIRGKPPARLRETLKKQNLIWISVNDSGGRTDDFERMLEAYGSLAYVLDHYKIDGARRYLGGFASGAHVASLFAQDYPQYFNGYLFFGGAKNWRETADANFRYINRHRYAFVAGDHDPGLKWTRAAYESFDEAGVENIALMVIDNLGHRLPDDRDFGEAIEYLDARPGRR